MDENIYEHLTRDYRTEPLKRGKSSRYGSVLGEIPPYEDVYYLYMTLNLNLRQLAEVFNRKRDSSRLWIHHYDIVKPNDLIRDCMANTSEESHGEPYYNNYQKAITTKIEKYGKAGNGEGMKRLFENATPEEKKVIVDKRKKTCVERCGYENYMQNPEFKAEFFKNMKRSGTKPEQALAHFFTTYDLKYEAQYVINYNDLVRIYDFYLPEYNVLIEYDGDFWHRLPEQKVNDQIKNEIADSLNYKLVRISGVNNLDFVWDIQYKFI